MHSSKKQFLVLEIAKINLRHNALLSIAVAVLLCLVTPFLIGTANLNRNSAAMPLEMFVSLIGIVLLTPVFQPEQNEEIDDLVSSKYCSTAKVHLIRTVYSVGIAALLICVFTVYMKMQSCDVAPILAFGTIADLRADWKYSHRIHAAAALLRTQHRYGAKAGKFLSVLYDNGQLHCKAVAVRCGNADDGSSFILSKDS